MKNSFYPVLLLFFFVGSPFVFSQPCTYLAYEGFDYPASTPLNALSGGGGWGSLWDVQNGSTTLPGYQISSPSLSFSGLQSVGNSLSGGDVYLTTGRLLNSTDGGPFDDYVAQWQSGIGTETNTTLWTSVVLRKEENNDETTAAIWHSQNGTWYYQGTNNRIGVGYFGAPSNVSGQRYWSLMVGADIYPTSIPVTPGTAAFFVIRIDFNASGTGISLYLNPATLGPTIPASPTMTQSASFNLIIRGFAAYLGQDPGSGAMDEIRMGTSYECVAPDASVSVNFPPVSDFTLSVSSGQAPLLVTLDGSSASDPENGALSYEWSFGDGTFSSGPVVTNHTYNILGELDVCLTVTDNTGQSNQHCSMLTVFDASNTFPCLTSFTVMNPVSCGQANGYLRVNDAPSSFSLRNSSNTLMTVTNGNEYQSLPPDIYLFTAQGTNGCRDTFSLHMNTDSSTCPGWTPDICRMEIGTNMSGFADWGVERPMKNLMKHVRPEVIGYIDGCWCWDSGVGTELILDSDGYPTHIPQTTSLGQALARYVISSESDNGTNLQAGNTYVLLFDGTGNINIGGGAVINSNVPGRIEFLINNNQSNYFIDITLSDTNDHVRNIRLLRIADEFADLNTQPFYQGFLNKIAPFAALRFMDWGHTNNNTVLEWTDRRLPSNLTYAGNRGVPYETMVQLANQAHKDVWICVPHQADDNYVIQMATYFRNNLDADLTVYLEYSNEVWNWIFEQAHYNADNAPSNLNYARAYSEKAKRIFRLWHQVYGIEKNRVKRVLGIQTTYNWLNEQILSQLDQNEWDLGAATHYNGLNHDATGNPVLSAASTPQDIITNARNTWYENLSYFKNDYNNIQLFGKEVVTYEGGQHFVGNVFGIPYAYQQSMWDAQVIPEMYGLYDEVLDSIRSWGCRLAMNFSLAAYRESVYGSWGAVDDIDTPPPFMTTAPKYQALLDNICPETPLPVDLPEFSVQPYNNEAALLSWVTLNESQNQGFEIQRGTDGRDFSKAGWVNGKNTQTITSYTFRDYEIEPDVLYYYRLKQVDFDGKYTFSEIKTLRLSLDDTEIILIPNPTDGQSRLITRFLTGVKIYDLAGSLIWQDKTPMKERTLLLPNLTPGIYWIKTEKGTKKWVVNP